MSKTEINVIECIKKMEEKLGINLNCLYAEYEKHDQGFLYVTVAGEVIALNGESINDDISIIMIVYNDKGQVVGRSSEWIEAENFMGFSSFDISCSISQLPVKVKVYPQKE